MRHDYYGYDQDWDDDGLVSPFRTPTGRIREIGYLMRERHWSQSYAKLGVTIKVKRQRTQVVETMEPDENDLPF